MTPEERRRLMAGAFRIEVTREEILEDLCYPGRSPGQWLDVPHEPAVPITAPFARPEREAA